MKDKILKISKLLFMLVIVSSLVSLDAFAEETKTGRGKAGTIYKSNALYKANDEGGKKGDAYRMFINNLNIPLNRKGNIASVEIPDFDGQLRADGMFDGVNFLFAGGFYIGGLLPDGTIWSNAVASASRTEDYLPGTWETGQNDPRAVVYVVKKSDGDFHQSWLDWSDAVDMGANFFDGDGDGVYNPVDRNGNGKWDVDEDRPDLVGDETVWCVYHDGLDSPLRRFNNVPPVGIEIRQTVFGFASKGSLGNILFIRYEITNTGKFYDLLDSVYFGVWADPDVGDYENDLVGCDTELNAGFTYDNGVDAAYTNSPCYLIDFFQGPVAYVPGETFVDTDGDGVYTDGVDTPLDTAYLVHGTVRGVKPLPGAKTQGLSSFIHYIQSHATLGDPSNEFEAYNYLKGTDRVGNIVDPCTFEFGQVRGGVNCSTVDPLFWYSGDPVADVGWICNINTDQRQMSNTGPFQLAKGETIEIVAAYVVGRASTSLASVNEAKKIDQFAQFIYDQNFKTAPPPPIVRPLIKTTEDAIELIWETADYINFREQAFDDAGNPVYDMHFEGFEVFMYNSNSTAAQEQGRDNVLRIATFDVDNGIGNIIVEDGSSGERNTEYVKGTQLDPVIFGDPVTGRILLRIQTDPFTNTPLVKGKPYYIGISAYAINYEVLTKLEPGKPADDKYLIPATAFIGVTATIPSILGDGPGIIPGRDLNTPFRSGLALDKPSGASEAEATYSVIDRAKVKNNDYEVSFFKDSLSASYSLYWKVVNKTTGEVVLDSIKDYNMTNPKYLADGVMLDIDWVKPKLLNETKANMDWLETERAGTGALYLAGDADTNMFAQFINNTKRSTITTFDKTRKVELRFGQPSNAYRYVKRATSLRFLFPDPNDAEQGPGVVQVPFSAWVKDSEYDEERQLAVAYLEKLPAASDTISYNDLTWNPGPDMSLSNEYIVIFSSAYDPNCGNIVYKGTGTGSAASKFADIGNGYRINMNDPEFPITPEQDALGRSPWFDAMYVVALETKDAFNPNFTPTGTYTINVNYPLTDKDKFTYKPSITLSSTEKANLFDKVNVYPNPLFGFNPLTSHGGRPDEPFITFNNLPEMVTVKIFTLSGTLVRTLDETSKPSLTSPFLRWDLENEDGLRVASGMYLAVVTSPGMGEKVLKFSVILPQKQIQRF